MRWLDIIFPPREDERVLRDVNALEFCARTNPQLVPYTRPATVALLPFFDPIVRAAVHEAKYHGSAHAFALLAAVLTDFLPDYLADSYHVGRRTSYMTLVPVPLGQKRLKERGYNQVEEVARRALTLLSMPDSELDATLLTRVRETTTQISLTRAAREANMRDAFMVHPAKLAERSGADSHAMYIVLDDVLTTGATLGAALDALVASGIPRDHLLPIALAH